MSFIVITCFVITCFSQCFVDETVDNATTFYYDSQSSSVCSDYYTISSTTCYILSSSTSTFYNEELIVDFRDFSDSTNSYFYYFFSGAIAPNMELLKIKPNHFSYIHIYTSFIVDVIPHIYFGCFGESGCNIGNYLVIHPYNKTFTFFTVDTPANSQFIISFDSESTVNPYLYVGGLSSMESFVYIENIQDSELFQSLSGSYYLFTSLNLNINTFAFKISTSAHDYSSFTGSSVCSRKDTDRYVMFHQDHSVYTNCSCWTKNNDTSITIDSIFNYPDCNYNSSMFDLILPTYSSQTYSLSDDLVSWYSIIFTTTSQSIQINDGKTLIIDELDLNQNDISFNGNVSVTNLTISKPNSSFNIVNFDNINLNEIGDNEVLFTIESTSTDLESHNLKQCGKSVITSTSSCECYYNGTQNEYFDNQNVIDNSCNTLRYQTTNSRSLIINSNEYWITSNEYWNYIEITESSLTIDGTYQLTSNICEFENKTITINCNLNCTSMNINSNTKIINNGELTIGAIVINEVIDNLNENGIIESYGSISITTIESTTSQSNCIEMISSNQSLSQPSISSEYSTLLLSQNHLLRICPSNTNYEVQCTTIANTFEQQSFDTIHCPCIDSNCIINVTTTQLDSTNISFNGTFNILTNSTIIISNQTTFSININDIYDKLLLIGVNQIGFPQSNTKSKSLSIQPSSTDPCNAILIDNTQDICIICNATFNYNGYCTDSLEPIDHCSIFDESYGCSECYEGYESKVSYCKECPSNCLRCYDGCCINCEMNYYINTNGNCSIISEPIISIENNKTMKCNDGYYSNGECNQCSDYCITCNSSECLTCNTNYTLNNGNCQSTESNNGEEIRSNYGVIDCSDGYYSNNSECIDCSLTFDNCEICNINGCLSCSNGVIINNGSCSLNTNCLNIEDSICLSCNDKGSWFNGNECLECGDNCKNCINGYCIECNDGYILQSQNNCIENSIPDNCITLSNYGTCQRCSNGYYLNNNLCYSCSNECSTCHNLTYCFECNDGYMLNDNNECVDISSMSSNCQQLIPGSSGGCAICNDGYYRDQTICKSCIFNCTKCYNGESCISCESNYFLLNDASECISYDDLTNCESKTQSGCTNCINDNYYINNQYCISCSNTTENCNTCNNNGECLTCQNDYILINYECINYQLIDNCKESSNSKCTSCSFWHTLNSDQTGCDTQVVWWVIVLIILFILMVLIGICVLIWYVIKLLLDWKKKKEQEKFVTVFDMSRSNIQFVTTNNKDVVINKNELLFNDECEEIGVNEETRDLICVGNTSEHTIKVQFSVKDGCDKYEIRTNPQLITIPKGKACEFEIFIKPLCTCKINDQIMLISVDLTKGKTITTPITINTITIMTTRLDYSELIEDIKLGEGSFGIVYKGTFRGNRVAIKKMRSRQNHGDSIEEFNKEVSMLDKFRNDYIVHFYGAVFIPNKICMVTEFAQYGSLQDLINKRKYDPIDDEMKMKILFDCSKGISYLHSNGILHRDIKPDNFLILSLENDVQVNAKLTDFGSSRNINLLMTNMTFTKGIGTPKYMAPEVLDKKKYKKSADIYSFAITIYETIVWDKAYDKTQFKFPWSIAEFVTNGERLPKPDAMNNDMYSLISNCWKQDPKERYEIENVVIKIGEMT